MKFAYRLSAYISVLIYSTVSLALPVSGVGIISQEVLQNDQVAIGTLVSLTDGDPRQVVLSDTSNGDYLFGVVTTTRNTLAEIGTDDYEGLPIAASGDASVVVSTINGDIQEGDVLGVSSIKGIATKVSAEQGATTIGVAMRSFDSTDSDARTVTATSDNGDEQDVVIGTIPVRLAINNFYYDDIATQNVVLSLGERFVGRPVSTWQVVAAAAILIASLVVAGIMMWNAVRGGFISIGRNPLSGNAVFNGLFFVIITSILIIIAGFIGSYVFLLL